MTWLSDDAVARLREAAEWPDFSGTKYRIVREVGRGGMGVVYEAEDSELERRVALKVMSGRMRGEARVIARLEHPGIVPVHDVGTLPDGRAFYAMKLVQGTRLDEYLAPRSERLRVFIKICEAVAFAHDAGIVHRDLKPQNVMVGSFGEVLVMDWADEHIAGTPGFMAPEQERGESIDARADIYALGAILKRIANDDKRVKAIAAKAMAQSPDDRYPDVRAIIIDITHFLDREPVSAYRENAFERVGRWMQRNAALLAVVAAYILMRTAVFLWAHR